MSVCPCLKHGTFLTLCALCAMCESRVAGTSSGCAFFMEQIPMQDDLTPAERSCLEDCRNMEHTLHRMWISAIEHAPKLARYCNCFDDFTSTEWVKLLSRNKSFVNIAPLHEFSCKEWLLILLSQPTLLEHCPCTKEFTTAQRKLLLEYQPQLKI